MKNSLFKKNMAIDENDYRVTVTNYKSYNLIHLENIKHLDLYNSNELTVVFEEGNEKNFTHWAIDMSNVQFLDSSGLGVVSKQARFLLKKPEKLILINAQSSVQHLLIACGLDWIFEFYKSKEDLPDLN